MMTNEETFELFKESCKEKVKAVMEEFAQERLAVYRRCENLKLSNTG